MKKVYYSQISSQKDRLAFIVKYLYWQGKNIGEITDACFLDTPIVVNILYPNIHIFHTMRMRYPDRQLILLL